MININKNLRNSLRGFRFALSDKSFITEILLGIILIPLVVAADVQEGIYKIGIILTYFLLIAFELMNTAIERLCDRVTTQHDEIIMAVKDMASASVFIVVLCLAVECLLMLVLF